VRAWQSQKGFGFFPAESREADSSDPFSLVETLARSLPPFDLLIDFNGGVPYRETPPEWKQKDCFVSLAMTDKCYREAKGKGRGSLLNCFIARVFFRFIAAMPVSKNPLIFFFKKTV